MSVAGSRRIGKKKLDRSRRSMKGGNTALVVGRVELTSYKEALV